MQLGSALEEASICKTWQVLFAFPTPGMFLMSPQVTADHRQSRTGAPVTVHNRNYGLRKKLFGEVATQTDE